MDHHDGFAFSDFTRGLLEPFAWSFHSDCMMQPEADGLVPAQSVFSAFAGAAPEIPRIGVLLIEVDFLLQLLLQVSAAYSR